MKHYYLKLPLILSTSSMYFLRFSIKYCPPIISYHYVYCQTDPLQIEKTYIYPCDGKPEKVRTSPCLVAPIRLCAACGQTGRGCLFRPPFLWFITFGGAKEMNIYFANPSKQNIIKENSVCNHSGMWYICILIQSQKWISSITPSIMV